MAEHATTTDSTPEHEASGKPRYDDVNTPAVVLVGFLSAIVTVAIIAAVQGLCYQWEARELSRKSVVNWPAKVKIEEQKAVLNGSDTIVSIEDAMNKVVASYGNDE